MYYIFSCYELDIIKKATTISPNEDVFVLMEKLKDLNLSFKEYLDSLSEEKVLEANSFDLIGNNHIITKFGNKIKNNQIEFNMNFNALDRTIDLLNTNHCLVIKEQHLNSLKKIPFTVSYLDKNNNLIESRVLLHCYKATYNKETQRFLIKNKCWFNEYFNYFNFRGAKDEHVSSFIRASLSFNTNTLSSAYNKDIDNFYANKILELNDYIALTSYCRNANKDIFELISKYKQDHEEFEYINFLSNLLKYNIGNIYNNECFESKFSFNLITKILLNDEALLKECFKSVYSSDYLYTFKKIANFFKNIFEEEKLLYEKEIKDTKKKSKKSTSASKSSKKKKKESSFEVGYELSKEYLEKIVNTMLKLHDELKYDDSEIEYFNNILLVFEEESKAVENSIDKKETEEDIVVETTEIKSNASKKNTKNKTNNNKKDTNLIVEQNNLLDMIPKKESQDESQISFI